MHLHSRIRDEIVKGTRQTQGWHEGGRKGEASRGQGFSGRGRARHGNKTRRTLISDSENREHEPCHTAHGSSSLSLSLSLSLALLSLVGLTGPVTRRVGSSWKPVATGCTGRKVEKRNHPKHSGQPRVSTGGMPYPWPLSPPLPLVTFAPSPPLLSSSRAHIVIGRGFLSSPRFLSDPHDKPRIFARISVTRIYLISFFLFFFLQTLGKYSIFQKNSSFRNF